MKLAIAKLVRNEGTQTRAELNAYAIDSYGEAMQAGATFPAVVVFYDGTKYYLADGFHRVEAAALIGLPEIEADVRQGTLRDAVLHSVGANATNGVQRTREDKKRAIERLLRDEEWRRWSDRKIAETCCVNHETVRTHRARLEREEGVTGGSASDRRYVTKHGTEAVMNTAGIAASNAARGRPIEAPPASSPRVSASAAAPVADDDSLALARDAEDALARARELADRALAHPRARGFVLNALEDLERWMRHVRREHAA